MIDVLPASYAEARPQIENHQNVNAFSRVAVSRNEHILHESSDLILHGIAWKMFCKGGCGYFAREPELGRTRKLLGVVENVDCGHRTGTQVGNCVYGCLTAKMSADIITNVLDKPLLRVKSWADMSMECFGMLMDGRAQPTGIRRRGEDATLLMVLNAYHDLVGFTLPETAGGSQWSLLIDTNLAEDAELGSFATGEAYGVTGRSLLLFALEPETAAT